MFVHLSSKVGMIKLLYLGHMDKENYIKSGGVHLLVVI